jgi:CRP-like cAMP-binding protein
VDDDALASVPFFSALSPAARTAIAPYAERIELEAGTQLTGEGKPGCLFFVIESGTAKVLQGEREIRELGAGDFFGEIALLETTERTASVTASTPMQVVVLRESAFKRLMETDTAAALECDLAMRERWASPIT